MNPSVSDKIMSLEKEKKKNPKSTKYMNKMKLSGQLYKPKCCYLKGRFIF